MGLDGVELVMAFEDEFELTIPNDAAGEMITVGDTVEYIVSQLRQLSDPADVCQTARTFYRLRNELMKRYGKARHAIQLHTPIGQLVPQSERRQWSKVADAAGLRREPFRLFGS